MKSIILVLIGIVIGYVANFVFKLKISEKWLPSEPGTWADWFSVVGTFCAVGVALLVRSDVTRNRMAILLGNVVKDTLMEKAKQDKLTQIYFPLNMHAITLTSKYITSSGNYIDLDELKKTLSDIMNLLEELRNVNIPIDKDSLNQIDELVKNMISQKKILRSDLKDLNHLLKDLIMDIGNQLRGEINYVIKQDEAINKTRKNYGLRWKDIF